MRRLVEGQQAYTDYHAAQHSARYSTAYSVRTPSQSQKIYATNTCADDVPMSRVKFNANTEYAYLQNFKVLQSMPPSPYLPQCSY